MTEYDIQHMQNTLIYMRRVKSLFFRSSDRIASIYDGIDKGVQFSMDGNPAVRRAIEKELQELANQINSVIRNGQQNEWMLGNSKMDGVLGQFTRGKTLAPAIAARWGGKNLPALAAFQARQEAGLGLSDRIWQTVRGQAENIERHLALGIYEGTDARRMASEMKQYLNDPDTLFRRVRDAEGNLRLSKAAQQYSPGQGRYRSAYQNALRLTRTETNLAYQSAENERREQMDFILDVRVQRSSSAPYDCDICEAGVGDYPKAYDWTAWHPNCLCFATDILPDAETIDKFFDFEGDPEEYKWGEPVQDIPDSMKEFMNDTNFQHYGEHKH